MRRYLLSKHLLLSICLPLLLSACATGNMPLQSPEQFHGTHGFVLVTLPQQDTRNDFSLQARGSSERIALQRHPELSSQASGLWLPPGEYSITDLKKADGQPYPPIRVERGRVTELGAVVTVPLGGYEFMTLAIPHPEASATAARAVERLHPLLSDAKSLHWEAGSLPAIQKIGTPPTGLGLIADLLQDYGRHVNKPALNKLLREAKTPEELYRLALTAVAPQSDEPGIDSNGTLYYGGELGQIRTRRPDGQWGSIDTGTLQTITAVEASGDRLLAGTYAGNVLQRSSADRPWVLAATLTPLETVVDIDRVMNRWIVVSVVRTPHPTLPHVEGLKAWKVYTSTNEDMSGLAPLHAAEFKEPIVNIWSVNIRGQYARADDYYINTSEELVRLDLQKLTWTSLKPPQDAITRFSVTRDADMLTTFYAKGIFSRLNVSTDRGATWKALDTPPYPVIDIDFDTPKTGDAARVNMGAFSSTVEFVHYDAGSGRWTKNYDAPMGCVRFLRDASSLQRICLTGGGSILNYTSGKWVAEFAVN